jgi:hypothetical protein
LSLSRWINSHHTVMAVSIAITMAVIMGLCSFAQPSDECPLGGSFCGMKSFASPGTL